MLISVLGYGDHAEPRMEVVNFPILMGGAAGREKSNPKEIFACCRGRHKDKTTIGR